MKYKDLLEKVENWQKQSLLKEYCQNVCGGECCRDWVVPCKLSRDECPSHLACSIYLCGDMIKLLNVYLNTIKFDFCLTMHIDKMFIKLKKSVRTDNVYSTPHIWKTVGDFRFDSVLLLPYEAVDYRLLRKLFRYLMIHMIKRQFFLDLISEGLLEDIRASSY